MRKIFTAGLFALAACVFTSGQYAPANAADLGGGSMKDFGYTGPAMAGGSAGPCYMRADTGYAWNATPDVRWPVTDTHGNLITDRVTNVSSGSSWLGEAGLGCGSGSRGIRGELVLGYRSERKIDGEPGVWGGVPDDPLHTRLSSFTAMVNGFLDLGQYHGFVPYVGVGIGAAYNMLDEVHFTQNPHLTNRIEGGSALSFAWSLMAGFGYQLSDRAILDVGYRYIDLGSVRSGRLDSAGHVNPPVKLDDLGAHELRIGVRWHLGAGHGCCEARAVMR